MRYLSTEKGPNEVALSIPLIRVYPSLLCETGKNEIEWSHIKVHNAWGKLLDFTLSLNWNILCD